MNRRYFFHQLASGLIAASVPSLFLPKLVRPRWKARPELGDLDIDIFRACMMREILREFEISMRTLYEFGDICL